MAKMASLRDFTIRIDQLAKNLQTNVEKVKRSAAIAIHQTVTVATPVLTGRAKNNWFVELNQPNRNKATTGTFDKSGTFITAQAKAVIDRSGVDDSIWISNNLDYIVLLNNGSSKKAPRLFVQRSIQTAVNFIRTAKVL
jgi:hypothetical protein